MNLRPSTSRTCLHVIPSDSLSVVTPIDSTDCTTSCTSESEKRRNQRSDGIAQSSDFVSAMAMIGKLQLSYSECADAVRQLLASTGTTAQAPDDPQLRSAGNSLGLFQDQQALEFVSSSSSNFRNSLKRSGVKFALIKYSSKGAYEPLQSASAVAERRFDMNCFRLTFDS